MKRLRKHPFIFFQIGLMAIVFVAMSIVVLACDSKNASEPDEACGSGRLTWDSKAGVCRDDVRNTVVDANCCGH